jgi:Heliorhodopsin
MNLKTLNLIACIIHFGLAILCIIYFSINNSAHPNQTIKGVELSVRDHTLEITDISSNCIVNDYTNCNSDGTGYSVAMKSVPVYTVDNRTIQTMLISFFIITGTFHLYYYLGNNEVKGTPTFESGYSYVIQNRNNYFRWIEYAITSTLMLYIIALVSNVKDTNVYLMLYATNLVMVGMGQQIEVAVRDGTDWVLPMIGGFILLFSEFSIIIRTFWNRNSEVKNYADHSTNPQKPSLPPWIKTMIILLFLFFSSFGFLSLFGSYSNISYEWIEMGYIILSLLSKTTLGIYILYANSKMQTNGWAHAF